MTIWTIEPRDPLIVRDGRPFQATPGAQAISLPFPLPATTTGMLRTQLGQGQYGFDATRISELLAIGFQGPLLVQLDDTNDIDTWYAPAPADCFVADGESNTLLRYAMAPIAMPNHAISSLSQINPIGLHGKISGKESKHAPSFWRWDQFEQWLMTPTSQNTAIEGEALGIEKLPGETRTHIAIDPNTQSAQEGALFTTSGIVFTIGDARHRKRLAIAVASESQGILPLFGSLGGERRVSRVRTSAQELPQCPKAVIESIARTQACRIILLTPAWFAQGYMPTWFLETKHGVTPRIMGISGQRPQVISGWDYVQKRAKPTRRLAPSGSVYFLKLDGTSDALQQWVTDLWMHCVSDSAPPEGGVHPDQYRLDGFGLAVLGTWDGQLKSIEQGD